MTDLLQSQIPITPDQIIEIIIRRKWFIIIPLCITLTLGAFYALIAPKTYEASTLILIQPQRVDANYVRSVVTSTISQRISTISQQILSRSNLEKIIDQFSLYENTEDMYLEDKIADLREKVQVTIDRKKSEAEAFSIVFSGDEPQTVMRVANTLASYFIDENLKVREAQAVGTSEFLESELEKTRKRLEEREKQLADYKEKYFGGLPDELETNLRTLDRLQMQINSQRELLQQTKNSLSLLKEQIAPGDEEPAPGESENEQKLVSTQKEYDSLLLKYTPKHPDVMKLKRMIENIKSSVEEEKKAAEKEAAMSPEETELSPDMPNSMATQQEIQVKQLTSEIKQLEYDISKLKQQMAVYQKRVEDTPKRELELQSLQRDYTNIQGVFNSLMDRKLEAELSVNMEKKQKGEQFRILDHARLPEKPISPNVQLLFGLSIVSGLGFAAGVIFLLESFNSSIRREDQIEKDLDLRILAAIPPIRRQHDKTKKRVERILFACCTLYVVFFLSFFAVLNYKGLDRTLYFIKATFNL